MIIFRKKDFRGEPLPSQEIAILKDHYEAAQPSRPLLEWFVLEEIHTHSATHLLRPAQTAFGIVSLCKKLVQLRV